MYGKVTEAVYGCFRPCNLVSASETGLSSETLHSFRASQKLEFLSLSFVKQSQLFMQLDIKQRCRGVSSTLFLARAQDLDNWRYSCGDSVAASSAGQACRIDMQARQHSQNSYARLHNSLQAPPGHAAMAASAAVQAVKAPPLLLAGRTVTCNATLSAITLLMPCGFDPVLMRVSQAMLRQLCSGKVKLTLLL
jgi:hypothetical protein